jgi:hypothetical protein
MLSLRLGLVAVSLLCIAFSACTPTSSSEGEPGGGPVPTSSMHMHFDVESRSPSRAVVSAFLDNGLLFGQQYRLDGGDYLRACVGSECKNLRDDFSLVDVLFPLLPRGYSNSFSFQSDIDYVVAFNRPAGGNAPNTRISLPPAFDIVSPVANLQVTDGDVLSVEWLPIGSNERISVDSDVDCQHLDGSRSSFGGPHGYDADRDGRDIFNVDDIVRDVRASLAPAPVFRCDIDITVEHERRNAVDPAFAGGLARGIVSRKVRVIYYPLRS